MAVAFGSIATATQNSGMGLNSLTIPKPSGLAAGNLLIAILGIADNEAYSLSGWTEKFNSGDTSHRMTVLTKKADAGDAAAANFIFASGGGSNRAKIGALVRVTGTSFAGADNITYDTDAATGTATPSYAGGVTPIAANSLLIMGAFVEDDVTMSGYAVTNNNPAWTEQADVLVNSTEDIALSVATATYAPTTTTGAYSLSLLASADSYGFLLSVIESQNAAGTTALLTPDTAFFAPVASANTAGTAALLLPNITLFDASGDAVMPRWTNVEKGTATWTDQLQP